MVLPFCLVCSFRIYRCPADADLESSDCLTDTLSCQLRSECRLSYQFCIRFQNDVPIVWLKLVVTDHP